MLIYLPFPEDAPWEANVNNCLHFCIQCDGGRPSALAHSEKTLARVYSNRDFDKLADALGTMETELARVFA